VSEFRASARKLAGLAGAVLGWRPDEFWRATPDELSAVFEALRGGGSDDAPPDASDITRLKEMFPDG
jgi:hypothetical protein